MPEFAGIAQADRLTVLDDVGNDEDFRVAGQQELVQICSSPKRRLKAMCCSGVRC